MCPKHLELEAESRDGSKSSRDEKESTDRGGGEGGGGVGGPAM